MKRLFPRLCLMLLAVGVCCLSGCVHGNDGISYFPYFWPTPGETFDKYAVRLEVRPLVDSTNPVRTQHVIIATVYDKENTPRRGRRIEWMIEGVGSIVEVDRQGPHSDKERERQRAVSTTSTAVHSHRVTRGNDNQNDDFMIGPGQTWCIVSSPTEGDTHVTVYAPGITDWTKSKVYTTIRWVDAGWVFPPQAQVRTGAEHVLTTKIFRHTDHLPLANYRVRYKIDGGPAAIFVPSRTQEYVAVSDLSGNAQVGIAQASPGLGINRVSVEIIRPPDPSAPSGSGVTLARGETTVEWLAPALSLTHAGPSLSILNGEVNYDTTVTNIGKVESRSMTVSSAVPNGYQYLRSNPPAFVDGNNLVWALPLLPAGQSHKVQATFRATKQGTFRSCAAVLSEEGLKDEKCVDTNVSTASLKVGITGPQAVAVGGIVNFLITANNPGGGPLDNVVLSATFSDGLEHAQRVHSLNMTIGGLGAGEKRDIPLELVARQAGVQSVKVMATSGTLSDQAQATVNVQKPQVSLSIDGRPATKYVGRPAEWTLVLTNPGDAVLSNVVVRDRLPPELDFVNADQGGELRNGEVTWNVGQLQPREQRKLKMTTVGKQAARAAVLSATVTADPGIREDAKATIDIVNTPSAFKFEFYDESDPVAVGGKVRYIIKVTNTGLTPAQGIEIKAVAPPELRVLSAKGEAPETIIGQMITFGKVDNVVKDRTLQYVIEAEGLRAGKVLFRAELRAQGIDPRDPVVEEENTTIVDTGMGVPKPP